MSTASAVADWANIFFIGSLVVGVVSTVLIVWMSGVKEAHWEEDRRKSAEMIAALGVQGDQLRKDTAEANAKALEARLELERFKAPRLLGPGQLKRVAEKMGTFAGTRFDVAALPGDPEALNFALQIAAVLGAAGWSWIEFNHPTGPLMTVYGIPGKPNIGQGGAWGVVVQTHSDHADEFEAAAKALAGALDAEGFVAAAGGSPVESIPNHDTVHIIVGKKI
ncbi:MAG: hypothetical protein P4M07_23635 [Xanthobacteraceae bacterium]|nr:hypothetical protein [Xanthobacteraceae bacterium]